MWYLMKQRAEWRVMSKRRRETATWSCSDGWMYCKARSLTSPRSLPQSTLSSLSAIFLYTGLTPASASLWVPNSSQPAAVISRGLFILGQSLSQGMSFEWPSKVSFSSVFFPLSLSHTPSHTHSHMPHTLTLTPAHTHIHKYHTHSHTTPHTHPPINIYTPTLTHPNTHLHAYDQKL